MRPAPTILCTPVAAGSVKQAALSRDYAVDKTDKNTHHPGTSAMSYQSQGDKVNPRESKSQIWSANLQVIHGDVGRPGVQRLLQRVAPQLRRQVRQPATGVQQNPSWDPCSRAHEGHACPAAVGCCSPASAHLAMQAIPALFMECHLRYGGRAYQPTGTKRVSMMPAEAHGAHVPRRCCHHPFRAPNQAPCCTPLLTRS